MRPHNEDYRQALERTLDEPDVTRREAPRRPSSASTSTACCGAATRSIAPAVDGVARPAGRGAARRRSCRTTRACRSVTSSRSCSGSGSRPSPTRCSRARSRPRRSWPRSSRPAHACSPARARAWSRRSTACGLRGGARGARPTPWSSASTATSTSTTSTAPPGAVREGAYFVATNLDATYPIPGGLLPGHRLARRRGRGASGVTPEVAGKPEAPTVELVQDRLGRHRGDGRRPARPPTARSPPRSAGRSRSCSRA